MKKDEGQGNTTGNEVFYTDFIEKVRVEVCPYYLTFDSFIYVNV